MIFVAAIKRGQACLTPVWACETYESIASFIKS